MPAQKIDLATQATATDDIDVNSQKIVNLVDPANDQDAATKKYVDDNSGAGAITRSGSTTDGHLAVWNGTDADSIKDGGEVPAGFTLSDDDPLEDATTADPGVSSSASRADHVHPAEGNTGFDPDKPPASPDAMDDEFPGTTLDAKWTTLGATAVWSVANGFANVSQAAANERCKVIEQVIGGTTSAWKFRTRAFFEGPLNNYMGCGFWVRDSVSGRAEFFTLMFHSTWGYVAPLILQLSDVNTYVSEVDQNSWFISMQPFLELEYDGTNFYFRTSTTGANFVTVYTRAKASYINATPTRVGIGIHRWGSYPLSVSFPWFRRMA